MPPRPRVARRPGTAPQHPIQVVARRTGLSADFIRAWEKRYDVVAPTRADSGRRLYSDADIERLLLLARATLSGRPIGQVAALTPSALSALVDADALAARAPGPATPARPVSQTVAAADGGDPRAWLARSVDAVERYDVAALDLLMRRASIALSAVGFLDALVVPLWHTAAARTREGTLSVAQERLALFVMRRALDRVIDATIPALASAPVDLLVTTPLGQTEEFGAVLVAATAAADSWRAIYVGAGLPAEAIAEMRARLGARAVALSLGVAASDRVIPRELRQLRALLPADVPLLVEGAASDAHRGVLREIDALVPHDPRALRAALRTALYVSGMSGSVRERD